MSATDPQHTHLNGLALRVHDPAGEPAGTVLLLHGIGGSAATFSGVAPRLAAAGWRAVAWDAPGYGDSAEPDAAVTGPDSPGAYVGIVARLIDDLDSGPVHLVGVSWGGVIATHVADRRPELVVSLTLLDSTRGSGTTPEKAATMRERVAELESTGGARFAAARTPRLLAGGADPSVAVEVERQMSAVRSPGYAGAAEMMAQSDTGSVLGKLQVPTLVLVGNEDRVTGVEEARLLAREIPNARFSLISNAGHAAVQEQPADVADALLGFLAQIPRAEVVR